MINWSEIVDLGDGDRWWSTRLFLLSSLLQALTGIRQLVFRDAFNRICGMASPAAVLDCFAARFQACSAVLAELRNGEASLDIEREINRQLELWAMIHEPPNGPGENLATVGLRAELLERLLDERLITRCILVDRQGLPWLRSSRLLNFLYPMYLSTECRPMGPNLTASYKSLTGMHSHSS
jgi:hypothetical protein